MPGPMHIALFSDYALRTLMYLRLHPDERVTLKTVADAYDISQEHLRKVVHRLAGLGYIDSRRGRNGGLRLALPARDIRVGEVVTAMEPEGGPIDCEGRGCRLTPDCRLRGALDQALQAFYRELDHYTLADITENEVQLVRLVG